MAFPNSATVMPAKNRKISAEHRKKTPKVSLSGTGYLEGLIKRNPVIRAALGKARERFRGMPGVCGIGVGRRFHENNGQYATREDFCIKVLVNKKTKLPKPSERIPRWIMIKPPGRLRPVRVEIDVI